MTAQRAPGATFEAWRSDRPQRRGAHLNDDADLLFDGIAYGMLLFVLAVGLAVTLGLMNFINLVT